MKPIKRIFLCKSITGPYTRVSKNFITINNHYEEAYCDNFGNNLSDEQSVLLVLNENIKLYVDMCDLELTHVRHEINLN